MKKFERTWRDALFSLVVVASAFALNVLLVRWFHTQSLIAMIFVLGVFLISCKTQSFFWGIFASLVSVLAVNYAFTFPYYAFDLISPECVASAVVMLIVSTLTGMLTTQIKRQEKIRLEMERERMRGNLLRAISHDLRTPLTSIYGASSAIIENYETLSATQKKELLHNMRSDAGWLIRMVENLLSVTRIDTGVVKLVKVPVVLEELIDSVLVKFAKNHPELDVHVDLPEAFVSIPMDSMLMEQVLLNLLENAAIHAEGMRNLWLRVTLRDGHAVFSVMDDGCGIAADRMENLFSGYLDRQNLPVDGNRRNMGIGLSVCAAIVKAHGGEISGSNRPEGGAAFTFSLKTEDTCEQSLQDFGN